MPHLVRVDLMPPTVLTGIQQEVDRRQRRPRAAPIRRIYLIDRPINLTVISALRMRLESERLDQLHSTRLHYSATSRRSILIKAINAITTSASCARLPTAT